MKDQVVEWPDVTVLVCTYEREAELVRTLTAWQDNLIYPVEHLHWLICDDSSPSHFARRIANRAAFRSLGIKVVSTEQNCGWGCNVNSGLRAVETDYCFFTEDDKLLYRKLDLRLGVALLETKPDVGYLRYRATAGQHTIMHQFEADVHDWLPDYMDGPAAVQGKLSFLQIDSHSPALYLYTHGPHLKHKRFHEFYGMYPEGLNLAMTEEAFCHQVKDGMHSYGAPALAILPEWTLPYIDDIGQSWQGSKWDK